MLEIHGKKNCPFAWRVRLTAREKAAAFDWLPFDVESPDPRAAEHNPKEKSPLLWQDGFALAESIVIAQYLDESCAAGRPLIPRDAKERARMRVLLATLVPRLEVAPSHAKDRDRAMKKAREGHAALNKALANTGAWLGGDQPLLPDLMLWPFLALQERDGASISPDLSRAAAYWSRAKDIPALTATRP